VNTQVFQELDRSEPNKWVFAPFGPGADFWPPQALTKCAAIEIELYNALPVPNAGVEYAGILDFKSRRQAELLQFRSYMDHLYLDVINSRDMVRSKTRALQQLDSAITDLAAALRASTLHWVWSSRVVPVLIEPVTAGFGAAGAADLLKLPEKVVVAAGVAGAAYKFATTKIKSPVTRVGPLPISIAPQRSR
jgi:hypothetical protein